MGVLTLFPGSKVTNSQYAPLGGLVLAYVTLAGALLQWIVQIPAQWQAGMGTLRLRFNFRHPAVQEVIRVMSPETLSWFR